MTDEVIPGAIGSRRAARERAVEMAYESEIRKMAANAILDSQLTEVDPFVADLLKNAESDRAQAEQLIADNAKGWSLSRIATMDKVIMRLAISELLQGKIPRGVILNEAVAMAGRYSTIESSRFVNGVLSSIADQVLGTNSSSGATFADDASDG